MGVTAERGPMSGVVRQKYDWHKWAFWRAFTQKTGTENGAGSHICVASARQELAFSTVTARRFCDQQEMSLHTATGRSLP